MPALGRHISAEVPIVKEVEKMILEELVITKGALLDVLKV